MTVQKAIDAIRAIHQLYPEDVAQLCETLSCKIAADMNSHLALHEAAVDGLDDLSSYIRGQLEKV